MRINHYYKNQPTFAQLHFRKFNNFNMFNDIKCKTAIKKDFGQNNPKDYFLTIENSYTPDEFVLEVEDIELNSIGKSQISLKNNNKTLYNDSIDVSKNRLKNAGAGTIMHLGHIITMMENNIDKIELYSLGQAVYFHSKFKFEPIIKNANDLRDCLQLNILPKMNDKRFEGIVQKTKEWLNNETLSDSEKINKGNKILYDYLQTVNKQKLNHDDEFQFWIGFDMILTKDKVMKNKDFFNNLFEKYDIDYQIKALDD